MGKRLERWLKPKRAVVALSPLIGDDRATKVLLAERLKDGLLRTSARYHTEAFDVGRIPNVFTDATSEIKSVNGDDIPSVSRGFPTVSKTSMGSRFIFAEHGRDLKRRIYLGNVASVSQDWERDLKRWDWATGTFVFSRRPLLSGSGAAKVPAKLRLPLRSVFYGVEFHEDDVVDILRAFGGSPETKRSDEIVAVEAFSELHEPITRDRSKGGHPKESERWMNFWNEVYGLLEDERLTNQHFQSMTELRKELQYLMGHGALGNSTIKPWVSRIWHTFIEPRRR